MAFSKCLTWFVLEIEAISIFCCFSWDAWVNFRVVCTQYKQMLRTWIVEADGSHVTSRIFFWLVESTSSTQWTIFLRHNKWRPNPHLNSGNRGRRRLVNVSNFPWRIQLQALKVWIWYLYPVPCNEQKSKFYLDLASEKCDLRKIIPNI